MGGPGVSTSSVAPLQVTSLTTTFVSRHRSVDVVRGVSFTLRRGETMMLLGESGSGKSVTARSIMQLYGASAKLGGSVTMNGMELLGMSGSELRSLRGGQVALIPQDPTGALDPLRRIGAQLVEVLNVHGVETTKPAARRRAEELLAMVGIPDPKRVADSYPHQLSGGMRQRAVIAIAVSCDPQVLIADEPTTALDVTVQAQILELIVELQQRSGTAVLMVTHDVGVARDFGGRIGVMYAGKLVEEGPAAQVLGDPKHPYTAGLLAALPTPGVERGHLRSIVGAPPPVGAFPAGCAFAPRCPQARPSCHEQDPPLVDVAPDRSAACPVVNTTVGERAA
ncbi:MAG: ABC transporter ATP-binding protein [Pseudonocardia sp.]|nr:ABC transporter ATP-binding protein [Pseudonocardia sp.]ODU25054.1 MAG: methionine ABC transporter ATP-binding protein [Pseudonocardia sp. SCN 72-51]ODV05149.1 MAG: methionine ABC transporter ATP-binding protein [Pseudonocardia sp. SCN 73-27]